MDMQINRATDARRGSPFLNTAQAAHYLGLSRKTLEKLRVVGGGPKFRKHGRYVFYHIDDLDGWSESRAQTTTSQRLRAVAARLQRGG